MSSVPIEPDKVQGQHMQPREVEPSPTTMQWVLLGLVAFLTTVVLALPVVLFFLTKNPVSSMIPVSTAIPLSYVWYRIIHFNFPKKKEDYDLEALKIKHGATMQDKIKRLSGQSLYEPNTQHEDLNGTSLHRPKQVSK